MAWIKATDGSDYVGPVHTMFGRTYSGGTLTSESVRLIEVPEKPAPEEKKRVVSKRTKSK
jgi:hypothetical protein